MPVLNAVFVEEFAYREDSRRQVGEYAEYEIAVLTAQGRVLEELREMYRDGQSALELFQQWTMFGEDVFIVPERTYRPFSAMDFARLAVVQITGDTERPLVLEVTCTDRLNTSSGMPSPPGSWTFWVHAPATFENAPSALRRAVDLKYDEMSAIAQADEGSSYTLLEMQVKKLSSEEFEAAREEHPRRVNYRLQMNGTLKANDGSV